jgi:hypothetical protein
MVNRHKSVSRGRFADNEQAPNTLSQVRDVLDEIHSLLADYSPVWFTQAHYERTQEALRWLSRVVPSR